MSTLVNPFKTIKKSKRKLKDNWCVVSLEYFKGLKEGCRNTWENQLTNAEREMWLNLYEKDMVALILDLEMQEYQSRFKTI